MSTVAKPVRRPLPVRVDGVTKAFGAFVALDDVSLAVPAGSVTALIGASGSGKSTLLRCVNGLEQVDAGQIHVGDVRTGVAEDGGHTRPWTESEASEARRRIGVVFQQFNLFPHCTVLENVTLAQRVVLGRSATEAAEIARLHLERLGLAAKVDAYPKRLSGGEQQRVAIARALAMDPGLILFDEPTSALDPERTLEVLAAMRELATDGITMVVVTHEMRFARDVSDQVVLMDHGRVVETGSADAIFEDPQDPLTRRFLQKHLDTPRTTRKDAR